MIERWNEETDINPICVCTRDELRLKLVSMTTGYTIGLIAETRRSVLDQSILGDGTRASYLKNIFATHRPRVCLPN